LAKRLPFVAAYRKSEETARLRGIAPAAKGRRASVNVLRHT